MEAGVEVGVGVGVEIGVDVVVGVTLGAGVGVVGVAVGGGGVGSPQAITRKPTKVVIVASAKTTLVNRHTPSRNIRADLALSQLM